MPVNKSIELTKEQPGSVEVKPKGSTVFKQERLKNFNINSLTIVYRENGKLRITIVPSDGVKSEIKIRLTVEGLSRNVAVPQSFTDERKLNFEGRNNLNIEHKKFENNVSKMLDSDNEKFDTIRLCLEFIILQSTLQAPNNPNPNPLFYFLLPLPAKPGNTDERKDHTGRVVQPWVKSDKDPFPGRIPESWKTAIQEMIEDHAETKISEVKSGGWLTEKIDNRIDLLRPDDVNKPTRTRRDHDDRYLTKTDKKKLVSKEDFESLKTKLTTKLDYLMEKVIKPLKYSLEQLEVDVKDIKSSPKNKSSSNAEGLKKIREDSESTLLKPLKELLSRFKNCAFPENSALIEAEKKLVNLPGLIDLSENMKKKLNSVQHRLSHFILVRMSPKEFIEDWQGLHRLNRDIDINKGRFTAPVISGGRYILWKLGICDWEILEKHLEFLARIDSGKKAVKSLDRLFLEFVRDDCILIIEELKQMGEFDSTASRVKTDSDLECEELMKLLGIKILSDKTVKGKIYNAGDLQYEREDDSGEGDIPNQIVEVRENGFQTDWKDGYKEVLKPAVVVTTPDASDLFG